MLTSSMVRRAGAWALCLLLAAIAYPAGTLVPVVGAPIFALAFGMAVANGFAPAIAAAAETREVMLLCLKGGIVLIGAGLDLHDVLRTGGASVYVLILTFGAGLLCAQLAGAWLGVGWRLRCLLGVGTIICGASAIAAVAPIIRARSSEIAYAIATVFLFNMAAVVVFPIIGHLLRLSDLGFGLWAGTAINDTSAVVAAGYAYGPAAGDYATIVKLTRTSLIIPVTLVIALAADRTERAAEAAAPSPLRAVIRAVPWFIGLFVLASMANTYGLLGGQATVLQIVGRGALLGALAAVGLQANWRTFTQAGYKPLLIGLLTWAVVAVVSLGVQAAMGQL
jgi:uncharacterized integral membrane protein (TIGR00698 family)